MSGFLASTTGSVSSAPVVKAEYGEKIAAELNQAASKDPLMKDALGYLANALKGVNDGSACKEDVDAAVTGIKTISANLQFLESALHQYLHDGGVPQAADLDPTTGAIPSRLNAVMNPMTTAAVQIGRSLENLGVKLGLGAGEKQLLSDCAKSLASVQSRHETLFGQYIDDARQERAEIDGGVFLNRAGVTPAASPTASIATINFKTEKAFLSKQLEAVDPGVAASVAALTQTELVSADRNGARLIDKLIALAQPSTSADDKLLAASLVRAVTSYGVSTNASLGTCAAESISSLADRVSSSEWARIAADLLQNSEAELIDPRTRNAVRMVVPLDARDPAIVDGRTRVDRVMQAAIKDLVAPTGTSYSSAADQYIRLSDGQAMGNSMSPEQSRRALELLTGSTQQITSREIGKSLVAHHDGTPLFTTLSWGQNIPGATRELNAVVVTRVDGGRVYFRNSMDSSASVNGQDLVDPARRVEDKTTGLESMKQSDFMNVLHGVVAADSRVAELQRSGLALSATNIRERLDRAASGSPGTEQIVRLDAALGLKVGANSAQLSFGVDAQGLAFLEVRNGRVGSGAAEQTMRIILDEGSLLRSGTTLGAKDESARLELLSSRLENKIHAVLKDFQGLERNLKSPEAAKFASEGHWGMIDSDLFYNLVKVNGARISKLENGELVGRNLTGLDFSGVKFLNFDLRENIGAGVLFTGATFAGTYNIVDNKIYGARFDSVTFEGSRKNSFSRNDFHGHGGSLNGANFGEISVRDNNFIGVDLRNIRAATIDEVSKAQATGKNTGTAAYHFAQQLGGNLFSRSLLSRDGLAAFSGGKPPKAEEVKASLVDIPNEELVNLVEGARFVKNDPIVKETRGGRPVQVLPILSADGTSQITSLVVGNTFGQSALGDDGRYATNLETLARLTAALAPKRKPGQADTDGVSRS